METNDSQRTPSSKSRRLWCYAIIGLTLIAYLPVTQCHYIWDDDIYVTQNTTLRSLEGLKDIWLKPGAVPQYYPLVHTTFWIEYQLWQLNPLGYHLVNVLLHSVVGCLLFILISNLGIPGAGLIAMVFVLHPLNVESVAWITERKNVLSAVFYFASFLAYAKFAHQNSNPRANKAIFLRPYFLSFFLYLGALLSKTVTCTLPVVLLIIHWWKGEKLTFKRIGLLIPFFTVGFAFGLFTVHLEKSSVGAVGAEWEFPFSTRCVIAGKALWFYIEKLVWPAPSIFIYPRWEVKDLNWVDFWPPLTFGLVLIGLFIFSAYRSCRNTLAGLSIYAISLFPALGFFNVYPMRYSFVADHFQYISGISVITLVIGTLVSLFRGKQIEKREGEDAWLVHRFFRLHKILAAMLIGLLATLTWTRCFAFINSETLWTDTLRKNPEAWIAHNNLGLIYQKQGRLREAAARFISAIDLKPDHAYAFNNLAMVYDQLGEFENAKKNFHNALKIKPFDIEILNNCGNFMARNQKFDEAVFIYQKALEFHPNSLTTLINLGNVLAENQQVEEAIATYKKVLAKHPQNVYALYNLGNALQTLGKNDEARDHYLKAIEMNPDFHSPREKLQKLQPHNQIEADLR